MSGLRGSLAHSDASRWQAPCLDPGGTVPLPGVVPGGVATYPEPARHRRLDAAPIRWPEWLRGATLIIYAETLGRSCSLSKTVTKAPTRGRVRFKSPGNVESSDISSHNAKE